MGVTQKKTVQTLEAKTDEEGDPFFYVGVKAREHCRVPVALGESDLSTIGVQLWVYSDGSSSLSFALSLFFLLLSIFSS